MNRRIGIVVAVVALLALGAAAQVTREEFDALAEQVHDLRVATAELRLRVIAVEAAQEAAVPADEAESEPELAAPTRFEALKAYSQAEAAIDQKWGQLWEIRKPARRLDMVRPTEFGYECLVVLWGRKTTRGGRPLGWENRRAMARAMVTRDDEAALVIEDLEMQIASE